MRDVGVVGISKHGVSHKVVLIIQYSMSVLEYFPPDRVSYDAENSPLGRLQSGK